MVNENVIKDLENCENFIVMVEKDGDFNIHHTYSLDAAIEMIDGALEHLKELNGWNVEYKQ